MNFFELSPVLARDVDDLSNRVFVRVVVDERLELVDDLNSREM